MGTTFAHRAESALIAGYIERGPDGLPRSRQQVFEEAQAHYMEGMTMAAALALLPGDEANGFIARINKAVDAVADTDEADADWPFVVGSLKGIITGIKERAAGILAQADVDRAMKAVEEEMEFDRLVFGREAGVLREVA